MLVHNIILQHLTLNRKWENTIILLIFLFSLPIHSCSQWYLWSFSNPIAISLSTSSFGLCSTVKNFGMGRLLQLFTVLSGLAHLISSSLHFPFLLWLPTEVNFYTKCRTRSISELQIHSYLTQQELTSNDYKTHALCNQPLSNIRLQVCV